MHRVSTFLIGGLLLLMFAVEAGAQGAQGYNAGEGSVAGDGATAVGVSAGARGANSTAIGQGAYAGGGTADTYNGRDPRAYGLHSVEDINRKALEITGSKLADKDAQRIIETGYLTDEDFLAVFNVDMADMTKFEAFRMANAALGTYNISNTTAVGHSANASGLNAAAVGKSASATAINSTAIGAGSVAVGRNSTAVGQGARASMKDSAAFGQGAQAVGNFSTAIGMGQLHSRTIQWQ